MNMGVHAAGEDEQAGGVNDAIRRVRARALLDADDPLALNAQISADERRFGNERAAPDDQRRRSRARPSSWHPL